MTITSILYYNSFSIIIIRHEYTYLVAATVVLMLFPNIDEPSFLCNQAESLHQPPLSPHYSYIDLFTMAESMHFFGHCSTYHKDRGVYTVKFMHEIYLCEFCESSAGHINLYCMNFHRAMRCNT